MVIILAYNSVVLLAIVAIVIEYVAEYVIVASLSEPHTGW